MSATTRLAYTSREAAEMCGVSEDTIRRAKNSGALKAKRVKRDADKPGGGRDLYRPEDLRAWIDGLADA